MFGVVLTIFEEGLIFFTPFLHISHFLHSVQYVNFRPQEATKLLIVTLILFKRDILTITFGLQKVYT